MDDELQFIHYFPKDSYHLRGSADAFSSMCEWKAPCGLKYSRGDFTFVGEVPENKRLCGTCSRWGKRATTGASTQAESA